MEARRRFSIREPHGPAALAGQITPQNIDMLLETATVAQFAQFSHQLSQQQQHNQTELKQNVVRSIDQVRGVAQAVQDSRDSLDSLKPTIDQLCDLLHVQLEMAQLNINKDTKQADRQSMMFLQNNWSSEVKELYSRIDLLSDMLPYSTDRRIDYESKKFWEFNPNSNKAIRPLHVVVLNDCLVIAVRSKTDKKASSKATHCWPVESLQLQSSEDSLSIMISTNKTSNGASSIVLKTNTTAEFNPLVSSIKNTMTKAKLKSNHAKHKSLQQLESPSLPRSTSQMRISKNLSDFNNNFEQPSTDSIKQIEKNVHIINELLTSLSLSISLKNYDSSVGFIKSLESQLEHLLTSYPQSVSQHISIIYEIKNESFQSLKKDLVDKLIRELSQNIESGASKAESIIELLKILGSSFLNQAQDFWLSKREKDLSHSVSALRFGSNPTAKRSINSSVASSAPNSGIPSTLSSGNGHYKRESVMISQSTPQIPQTPTLDDANIGPITPVEDNDNEAMAGQIIVSYVRELSLLHVGICIRTWKEYQSAFSSGSTAGGSSKVFDWIISKMESLKLQLQNVLVDYDTKSQVWLQSILILKSIYGKLSDLGLDVSFVFDDINCV